MTSGTVTRARLLAAASAVAFMAALSTPAGVIASATDPDLRATLELDDGEIDYTLELGTLHFFDEEGKPLALQIIDGCAINDHLWIFGGGLSGIPARLNVMDLDTGENATVVLPAYEPGKPVGTVFEPEALELCPEGVVVGGLPSLDATATFTSANARGQDGTDIITLLSDGRDNAYRRLLRGGASYDVISRGSPVVAVDDNAAFDQLYLFSESRTPRQLEGIVFTGNEGMIAPARLARASKDLTNARVRRAYETAKNGRVPQGIIEDLGLRRVDRVHHVSLVFDQLGAAAYLAAARWIKEGGRPIEPPSPVEERFIVELSRVGGAPERVPLVGPLVGSDAEGLRWEYASEDALVQVIDVCALDGSFWTWAGALTDEPLELRITDTVSGAVVTHPVWTDRRDVSRHSDTSALDACS